MMDTKSHGGGFRPFFQEFWYPEWAGSTIYRYSPSGAPKGSFTAGIAQIMQVWGETTSEGWYGAHWGFATVVRHAGVGTDMNWTVDIGMTASGICADENYAYAIGNSDGLVWVTDKSSGALVKKMALAGNVQGTLYGSLAVHKGLFYSGRAKLVTRFSVLTGQEVDSFATTVDIYNMAFTGKAYCVSANSNSLYCHPIVGPCQ